MAWSRAVHRGKEWGAVINVPGVPKKFVTIHPDKARRTQGRHGAPLTQADCADMLLIESSHPDNTPEARYIYGELYRSLTREVI